MVRILIMGDFYESLLHHDRTVFSRSMHSLLIFSFEMLNGYSSSKSIHVFKETNIKSKIEKWLWKEKKNFMARLGWTEY